MSKHTFYISPNTPDSLLQASFYLTKLTLAQQLNQTIDDINKLDFLKVEVSTVCKTTDSQ